MESKIQELTQKLYEEGLAKGKTRAEALVAQAQEEADRLVAEARKEAQALLEKAQKEADELSEKTLSDVRMAARHSLTQLREQISDLVLTRALQAPLASALDDSHFLQDLIFRLAAAFDPQGGDLRLEVALPPNKQQELKDFVARKAQESLKAGLTFKTDEGLDSGFSIAPQGGGFKLRFSQEDFENLFRRYLQAPTYSLLFDQEG